MGYRGGKVKIGEEIAQFINDKVVSSENKRGKDYDGYCEPFCGYCGVYRHIPDLLGDDLEYLGGDGNVSVVKMWQGLQGNWQPPKTCSKQKYESLKKSTTSSAEKGFIGHVCSCMGIYFAGMNSRGIPEKTRKGLKDIGHNILADVEFSPGSYTQYSNLKNYIIYCDPPYINNSQYYNEKHELQTFDTDAFIDWCRKMKKRDNLIIVSEHKGNLPFKSFPVDSSPNIYERLYLPSC